MSFSQKMKILYDRTRLYFFKAYNDCRFADVVELVDTPDLGSGAARRGGSSPFIRTNNLSLILNLSVSF